MTARIIAVDTSNATHIVTGVQHWTLVGSKVTVLSWYLVNDTGAGGYRTRVITDVVKVRDLDKKGGAGGNPQPA